MRQVPQWSQYFMEIAKTVSLRSKDPMTQVGAVIVNKDQHIIATGYNGFAPGMEDRADLWQRPTKYDYVVHAEANALLNCTQPCANGKLFVTLYPCKECAKLVAGARIKQIYYLDDRYKTTVAEDLFNRCGVQVTQLK